MLLKNTDFSPSSFSKGHFNLSCLWVSITFATHECYLHNRRARLMLGQTFHKNSILSLLAAENGLQNWFASSSFKDFFISQYFGNHESQNHVKIHLLVFSIMKPCQNISPRILNKKPCQNISPRILNKKTCQDLSPRILDKRAVLS